MRDRTITLLTDRLHCIASVRFSPFYPPALSPEHEPMKTIVISDNEWKNECLRLARQKKAFEVHGVSATAHLDFCAEICACYEYRSDRNRSVVKLTPLRHG